MPDDGITQQIDQIRSGAVAAASEGGPLPSDFNDEALALRFTAKHGDELRYVAAWGKWMIWDGAVWRFDDTLRTLDWCRAVCRAASAECENPRTAAAVASSRAVSAVERLARADRKHAATPDDWDADPWLLNTPGGIVNLRTGQMREHAPSDYVTKRAAVTPGGECPTWHTFLARITGGNGELHDFLQRVSGYSLTGITRDHAMFFGYGTGANGKGTFLNTMSGILGDYATIAPIETFTSSRFDRHPTELAMLRGARLVTAQETEEGRNWAEARIKALTGGDPISARFMNKDFFTFLPQFKLFIAGNHKPGLRGVDEAIRRRLNLVPFTVTIPAGERDAELAQKLKAEWPGILAWAIEGCRHWLKLGLKAPEIVRTATDEYLEDEDAIGGWLQECCWVGAQYQDAVGTLFQSWSAWAQKTGEPTTSQKKFSQSLEGRGFRRCRQSGTGQRRFDGVAVKAVGW